MQFAQDILEFGNSTQGSRAFLAPVNDAHGQNGRDDEFHIGFVHINSPSLLVQETATDGESESGVTLTSGSPKNPKEAA